MPRKILIVDDDQKTRLLLKSYLEKNQYEVVLAHNGDSFLAEFQRHADQLSMVILDVMLPDTDGFALCREVRHRQALQPSRVAGSH
jgi:DNA-binding response OmpR family regulator